MTLPGGCWSVKDHFSSLKVHPPVRPSAALQQNRVASCPSSDLQNTQGLLPDQPKSSVLSSTALPLQPAKPVGRQAMSSSLWEAAYKKDVARSQPELRELPRGLLQPPVSNASAQQRAHPDSALRWSAGEQYVYAGSFLLGKL